jgi:ferritin-like metal-binding protein YciE
MAAKTQSRSRKSTNGRHASTNGNSQGMTEMVSEFGRKASKGLRSLLPESLGGGIDMEYDSLRDLFVKELEDLLSAEQQLLKALPKMAKAAYSPALRDAYQSHLKETEGHVKRLEQVFKHLGMKPKSTKCKAMAGLVAEGDEWMKEDASPGVMDAGLIAAAQRVEHYEMAGYGCVRTYAKLLGDEVAADLLQSTLDEEGAADKKLTQLSKQINVQAAGVELPANHSTKGRGTRSKAGARRRRTASSRE